MKKEHIERKEEKVEDRDIGLEECQSEEPCCSEECVDGDAVDPRDVQIEDLKTKMDELKAENAGLKDQMARRQAEIENYRKRLVRDKEEAVQFANSKLIGDILPFLDNLDRALVAAKAGGNVENLVQGIEMAQGQLMSNLDKNWGLKAIESVGKEFDPQMHEACMVTVDDSLENETVLEDFLKGYTLHDRVLRPSKVRIGKPE